MTKKKNKKQAKAEKAQKASTTPCNAWDALSATVYSSPSALNDIILEQQRSESVRSSGGPRGTESKPNPVLTTDTASKTSVTPEKKMPTGVWSLAGWKMDEKIQGALTAYRLCLFQTNRPQTDPSEIRDSYTL